MGKGRRGRAVPFGAKTADAPRRYLRARAVHPPAHTGALWLGKKGRVTDSGVRQILERRAAEAGVDNVRAHRFRRTYAHTWLAIPRDAAPDADGRTTALCSRVVYPASRPSGRRCPEPSSMSAASVSRGRARQH